MRVAEWRRDFDARRMASNSYRDECYRQSESKGPSVGSIVLGVGGAILGILGICALANSSSDGDSYSGIEDYDYDYSDYSSYYTYDDYY